MKLAPKTDMQLQGISAVTLKVSDMDRAVTFYSEILGLELTYGGKASSFSTLRPRTTKDVLLNLERGKAVAGWGRIIFYVQDIDAFFAYLRSKGFNPPPPRDAQWGERFFHMADPDGHELSFAQPLR